MPTHPSKQKRIYLDYNASAPTGPAVRSAVTEAMLRAGNPSSPHAEGRAARHLIDAARQGIADSLAAASLDIVFCSGGTEANHIALLGLARLRPIGRRQILLPKTVHPSLWAAGERLVAEGYTLCPLPVDSSGKIDLGATAELLKRDTAVLAFSLVNHELGTIEDAEAIVELAHEAGSLVHCDAVQGLGRVVLKDIATKFDSLSLSAHKIGGPKGIGALWVRPGLDLGPLVGGGKQESGRRPGTQGVAMIAGFGAALSHLSERLEDQARQRKLTTTLALYLREFGAQVLSDEESGVANTVCAQFSGIPGDILVSALDLAGIAISTGAACSSGSNLASEVLLAIGLNQRQAKECIRISIGPESTEAELNALAEELPAILERARQFS